MLLLLIFFALLLSDVRRNLVENISRCSWRTHTHTHILPLPVMNELLKNLCSVDVSLRQSRMRMKITFGSLVIAAGICGILSFALLATSLGTDYWFIIEMRNPNTSGGSLDFEDMSSRSGLLSINEGGKIYGISLDFFRADVSKYSDTELQLLNMHRAVVVLLPLSLVLILFGGIAGLVSSLARSPVLLTCTASYFFICSLLTLCGIGLYIIYSYEALAETERLVGPEILAYVSTSFGWSVGIAWLSYGLEVLAGTLLLVAAQVVRRQCNSPTRA